MGVALGLRRRSRDVEDVTMRSGIPQQVTFQRFQLWSNEGR